MSDGDLHAPFGPEIAGVAAEVIAAASARPLRLAAAESCTGGLVGAALTAIPGSSAVFERGFVTYSNEAKVELLGVDPAAIAAHGAVSGAVARQMAAGARGRAGVELAVAVTGVAGPGGSDAKPEGLVHFAAALLEPGAGRPELRHVSEDFGPLGRGPVRLAATLRALELLREMLER